MTSPTVTFDFEATLDHWRRVIGSYVLTFGELEYCVKQCLIHISAESIWPVHRLKDLSEKIKVALVEVEAAQLHPEQKRRLLNVLNRTLVCAKDRNLLAHNPLHVHVYADNVGNFSTKLEISSLRKEDVSIDLDGLVHKVNELVALHSEFHSVVQEALWR